MKRTSFLILVLTVMSASAAGQPVTMHCRQYDETVKDFSLTSLGERFLVIDSAAKTVKADGVLLSSSWSTKELQIEEPDRLVPGAVARGYLLTVIDRSTGYFLEFPMQRAADGTAVKPVNRDVRHGACEIYRQMF